MKLGYCLGSVSKQVLFSFVIVGLGLVSVDARADEKSSETKISAVTVKGFADARFKWGNENPSTGSNPAPANWPAGSNGFVLNDGAIYLNNSSGATEFSLDLPFKYTSNTTNDLSWAKGQAQVFMTYKTSFGLKAKIGQFDSIYGFEGSDSADRKFSNASVVATALTTASNQGLVLMYDLPMGMNVSASVGNASPAGGSTPAGADQDKARELGALLGWSNESLHGSLGYRQDSSLTARDRSKTDSTYMAFFGGSFGDFSFDTEFYMRSFEKPRAADVTDSSTSPSTTTFSPAGTVTPKSAQGYAIHLNYQVTSDLLASVRYSELMNYPDIPYALSEATAIRETKRQADIALGVAYKVSALAELRAEYTLISKKYSEMTYDTSAGSVGMIHRF